MDSRVENRLKVARNIRKKHLDLSRCYLTEIPEEVFAISHLETIDLSANRLRTVPAELKALPNLYSVNLFQNPVEHLPNLPGLEIDGNTYLGCRGHLDRNNVQGLLIGTDTRYEDDEFWARELPSLNRLRRLLIGEWNLPIGGPYSKPRPAICKIFDSLGGLKQLVDLSLSGWRLGAVPEVIQELGSLKVLDLSGLELKALPEWIGDLGLQQFSAFNNQIRLLPDSLCNLTRLHSLDLSWNPLGEIPKVVFDLARVKSLDLSRCDVREVPPDIMRLTRLRSFKLHGNPIEVPPVEVVKEGLRAIRNYWRQRADAGVDYLFEAKLIILGEPGAGKTSLARKIENPDYKLREREPSTEGIDVIRHQFPTAIHQRSFQVNIWDFGGQEIYHATHQFFLTRRSVYVIVCDDRKEDTDFSYWLQVVEMLSDGSPVLIVQNEKQDRTRDINLSSLRGRFASLRDAVATNLDTNRGLDQVIQSIRKELEHLPHVGIPLPSTWKRVREALEQDQRDHISLEEYLVICQQHGFIRHEDKLQLSGYLHDLGICLHFQDDPLLNKTVVLKPAWGTDAVYRVLDDAQVIAARGQFTGRDLKRIWSEPKYERMRGELLGLMMKFQLCYQLDDQTYVAPQLLSSDQPSYPWDVSGGLVVRYEYGFLPKGIITRFIVAMNHLIGDGKLVWKTGVILDRNGSRAEVIEEYGQRRIRVRLSGPDVRGLLAIVDDQLERLHRGFPRLQYDRYLPCPCKDCQGKPEPYAFPLANLKNMAAKGRPIQCHHSGEMVDSGLLICDLLPSALRRNETIAILSSPTPEVFVSYAWSDETNALVDRLQEALTESGVRLIRDREEVRYKDSIRDFMRRIGKGKAVVVIISEKYLKSENCMFEMLEIAKAGSLRERIFPIVLPDANIYKAVGLVRYASHWEQEIRELDEALKTVRGDSLTKLQENLNLYAEIRRLFDGITDTLRDMNALADFDELIRRIKAQVGAVS